ncbi:MAG: hypothetical protein HYV27_15245 [Candidatus Hydrogenedentes bacterium]|nr:hypothetical protein [Candidatus Hydrogenedentota bacterium]
MMTADAAKESLDKRTLKRLGKEPDAAIAADIGRSAEFVRRRRVALGIPAFRREITWSPAMNKTVIQHNNATAAEKLGISQTAVKIRRHRLKQEPTQ